MYTESPPGNASTGVKLTTTGPMSPTDSYTGGPADSVSTSTNQTMPTQNDTSLDNAHSRKRTADGHVKMTVPSPPPRGHSRNTSTMSAVSTASTIGELSADLKTRLSYAMMKVNHGWQNHSLDEVESLASRAASPASSQSTAPKRQDSSASPRSSHQTSSQEHVREHVRAHVRKHSSQLGTQATLPPSKSPPTPRKPTLAPPAPIEPSSAAASSHPRRNSNPRYGPSSLLTQSQPGSATQPPRLHPHKATKSQGRGDILSYSPHQNVREQDAIETLLFMSSPGNSANMKHAPHSAAASPRASAVRHALPGSPRKALPSQRPGQGGSKRAGSAPSPGGLGSPMDTTSPFARQSPHHAQKRPVRPGHAWSSSISMAAALGGRDRGYGARKLVKDDDIERLLDRAGSRMRDEEDSSDGEDIQIPPRPGANAMKV